MGAQREQLPKMGHAEIRNLGVLLHVIASGQKRGTPRRGDVPHYYLLHHALGFISIHTHCDVFHFTGLLNCYCSQNLMMEKGAELKEYVLHKMHFLCTMQIIKG